MQDINKIDFSQYLSDEICLKLVKKVWETLSETEKLELAQTITETFLKITNIDITIKISFAKFEDDYINGEFNFETNELLLNKHYFIEGYRLCDKEKRYYSCSNSCFYHVIMHELKHVEQRWLMQHPEYNPERAKILNTNNTITKKYNMYIMEGNLYRLQISEREAFEFEMLQQMYLHKRIEKLVISDIAFGEFEMFSYFLNDEINKTLKNIKANYQTNTPEQDLDNIMDAIINNKSYDNLNQIMLKEVLKITKTKSRFFPFFNQTSEHGEEECEVSIKQNEIENSNKILDNTYNDWFDNR